MKAFKYLITAAIILSTASLAAGETPKDIQEYGRLELDRATCDVGVLLKPRPDGMDVIVAAIATGRGAEFRKWKVTGIWLSIGGEKFRPDAEEKFFVNKESLFRLPAAVVFAVIGAQIPASGSDLQKGITRTGAAIGLSILAFTAKGDITGQKSVFRLDGAAAARIAEGRDFVEITVENEDLRAKQSVHFRLRSATPSVKISAQKEE